MSRPAAVTLAVASAGVLAFSVVANGQLEPDRHASTDGHDRVVGVGVVKFDGRTAERWARAYHREHRQLAAARRQLARERRVLLERPNVVEAINLASAVYGYGAELWRKARCESGLEAGAANPSGAAGLFQFLGSTWASTPFAGFSVWSPYANALAAGWMHAHGRGGEWACR